MRLYTSALLGVTAALTISRQCVLLYGFSIFVLLYFWRCLCVMMDVEAHAAHCAMANMQRLSYKLGATYRGVIAR